MSLGGNAMIMRTGVERRLSSSRLERSASFLFVYNDMNTFQIDLFVD